MVKRGSEYWLLGALVVLLFHQPLTTATFYFRDLYLLFYPKHLLLTAAIRARELPLWDPLTHGGQPYLATPSNAFFQPFNLLYLALPPIWAFNIAIVLQFALAATGACWLARRSGLSRPASFAAGAVFGFCGYMLSSANLLLIFSLPAFPFAIAFLDVAIRDRKRWAFVASGIAIAWPLWSGGAEAAACMILTIGCWVLAIRPNRRAIVSVAVIGALGIALAAVVIVPAMEVIRNSSRSEHRTFERFTAWSVDPRRLPELVVPQFLGRTDRLDEREFWGQKLETENFPYMLSLYFGALTLLLAGWGIGRRANRLPRKTLAALAVLGLLLSLGRWLPLLRGLYELVPLVGTFRFPVKAIMLALLPIALLTGSGIDRAREEPRRGLQWMVGAVAAAMLLLSILFASSSGFAGGFALGFFGQAATPLLRAGLARSFLHAALVLGAAALAISWGRERTATMLAALVAVDLLLAGWSVNAYAPRAIYDPPSFLPQVSSVVGPGRLYREQLPKPLALRAPSDDIMWIARWKIESLSGYTAAMFGIPVIFHEDWDQLAPRRVAELNDIVARAPWPAKLRLLEAGGVRAVITHVPLPENGDVVRLARMQTAETHPLFVYSLRSSTPARFVSRTLDASSPREALALLVGHADASTIVLEQKGSGANCGGGSVTPLTKSLNASRWSVDAPCRGYAYFAETWYPGWRARVDGAETPVIRANYAFSAVAVGQGKHVIEKSYEPRLPLIGALVSLVALVLLLVYAERSE